MAAAQPYQLRGTYVASTMPLTPEGGVDLDGFARHCAWLADSGVVGIIPNGSLGEYETLSDEGRAAAIKVAIDAVGGKIPIIPGVSAKSGTEARRWAEHAASLGCPAVMALPPTSHAPTWDEVVAHFKEIARVGLPIIAYNNPFSTRVDLARTRSPARRGGAARLTRKIIEAIVATLELDKSWAHTICGTTSRARLRRRSSSPSSSICRPCRQRRISRGTRQQMPRRRAELDRADRSPQRRSQPRARNSLPGAQAPAITICELRLTHSDADHLISPSPYRHGPARTRLGDAAPSGRDQALWSTPASSSSTARPVAPVLSLAVGATAMPERSGRQTARGSRHSRVRRSGGSNQAARIRATFAAERAPSLHEIRWGRPRCAHAQAHRPGCSPRRLLEQISAPAFSDAAQRLLSTAHQTRTRDLPVPRLAMGPGE